MKPLKRPATYDDLLAVPDSIVAEIIDGELYATPRPAVAHSQAETVIAGDLGSAFNRPAGKGGPGGWWILVEPELHLGADVVVPDVAGWRRERLPALPNAPWLDRAPDWACEVMSPTTASLDRVRKMRIYARERIGNLWLVDPLQRTLEIYRLEGDRWIVAATHAGAELVRLEPFEAIEIDLSRWWLGD